MKIKGKTTSNFEFEIDTDSLNDMEVVDALVDMMDTSNEMKAMKSIKILLDKVLGTEQKQRLYDHVKVDGRAPIDKINNEFVEILSFTKEGKN